MATAFIGTSAVWAAIGGLIGLNFRSSEAVIRGAGCRDRE